MGDTDKTVEASSNKGSGKGNDTSEKKSFFKGVKNELKFVKWPTKQALIKDTSAVLVISIVLGALISLVDLAFKFGIDKLLGIG